VLGVELRLRLPQLGVMIGSEFLNSEASGVGLWEPCVSSLMKPEHSEQIRRVMGLSQRT